MMETIYSKLKVGNLLQLRSDAQPYQKVNSSIVSKVAMNSFDEMLPLAVMHRGVSFEQHNEFQISLSLWVGIP